MLAGLRATQRFSLVIYIGVLMLSAVGSDDARRQLVDARAQIAACAAVCAGCSCSRSFRSRCRFTPTTSYAVSAPDRAIASYQRSRPTPLVVLHLPINYFREPYPVSEATYMLDSTAHWANILNGFSGGVPQGFMERMTTLNTAAGADGGEAADRISAWTSWPCIGASRRPARSASSSNGSRGQRSARCPTASISSCLYQVGSGFSRT